MGSCNCNRYSTFIAVNLGAKYRKSVPQRTTGKTPITRLGMLLQSDNFNFCNDKEKKCILVVQHTSNIIIPSRVCQGKNLTYLSESIFKSIAKISLGDFHNNPQTGEIVFNTMRYRSDTIHRLANFHS